MNERAAPFYCPYCGEEDIRPDGEAHGQWRCAACTRVWTLRYVGLRRSPQPSTDPVLSGLPVAASAAAAITEGTTR